MYDHQVVHVHGPIADTEVNAYRRLLETIESHSAAKTAGSQ